jgi:hypothetical protein
MRTAHRFALLACSVWAAPALAQSKLVYTALPPCRIVDTRSSAAGRLVAGVTRTFHVVGPTADFAAQGGTAGGCGIPGFTGPAPQAVAVASNFVAVNPTGAGNLRAWATANASGRGPSGSSWARRSPVRRWGWCRPALQARGSNSPPSRTR